MLHITIIYIVIIFIILSLSALYAAAETSMTSISQPLLHKLKKEGNRRAILVSELRKEKGMLLGALLIASTALDTTASSVAILFAVHIGGIAWIPVATTIVTIVIVVLGNILPKTYAFENPMSTAFAVAPFIKFSIKILFPLVKVIQLLVRKIFEVFKLETEHKNNLKQGAELVRGAIELGHSLGYLLKDDREMLYGVLKLNNSTVKKIMTPKNKIYSYDINIKPNDLLKRMLQSGHSRFPIYENEESKIVGVMHIKDLFNLIRIKKISEITKKDLLEVMAPPWFIPGTKLLSEQLKEFRSKKIHFAMIIDKKNIVQGIITLEDILEEIVGSIDDEHNPKLKYIEKSI